MDPRRAGGGPDLTVEEHLDPVYANRFGEEDTASRDSMWREICRHLQRHVPVTATVLDIGCDQGTFIRHIRAGEKWASDVRDMSAVMPRDVHFVCADGLRLGEVLAPSSFDMVFMSNYLEHLASSDAVIEQLGVARRLLRPGGRVMVMQPNIRLVGGAYWDFIDHRVPLTERSLEEAATVAGFRTERLVTRFLPYTTKSRLPRHPVLVRAYLAFPPAWRLLGKQTLYVGERV